MQNSMQYAKGLSVIANRQRRKDGRHILCVGVGGDLTHAARPGGAGYDRLCQLG
jgi:hypothetical protein